MDVLLFIWLALLVWWCIGTESEFAPLNESPQTAADSLVFPCRYHATLLLKRMKAQEQGQYTFHARSNMANASITFQVQMYRKWNSKHKLQQHSFVMIRDISKRKVSWDNLFWHYINKIDLTWIYLTERPVAVVRWENVTTLTCTSFGYPAPRIKWYQCFGIRPTWVLVLLFYTRRSVTSFQALRISFSFLFWPKYSTFSVKVSS